MTAPRIVTVPGASPVVQVGVGDTRIPTGQARWDVSEWDVGPDAEWAGTEPTWVDVSCDVIDADVTIGRDRTMVRWPAGTAVITFDNRTGLYDMRQGVPLEPLALSLTPGRQLRVGVALDGAAPSWLFRGFIDEAEPVYDPVEQDVVVVSCIDAKGEAGKVELAKVDVAVGTGETANQRINRLLDLASWPAGSRAVAASSVTLLASPLGAKTVDLLDVVADSAGGAVFGDTAGRVVFKPQDWQTWTPDQPPDDTIGNGTNLLEQDTTFTDGTAAGLYVAAPSVDPGTSPGLYHVTSGVLEAGTWPGLFVTAPRYVDDVCPGRWERAWRRSETATRVIIGRPGEEPDVYDNADAQAVYGVETLKRTDLLATLDAQLELVGRRWLEVASPDYMPRIEAVTIDAGTSTRARDLAASADPTKPSRYRCRLKLPDGRVVFDAQFLVTGVEHVITAGTWTCRLALDDAAAFGVTGDYWDQGRWDTATWSGLSREENAA